jgi:integrase
MLQNVEKALIDQKQYTLLHSKKVFLNPFTNETWTGDQQIRKGFWIPLLKKAGVRYRNPYQTRHTFASMMLSAGENIAWVSSQMGHSNIMITTRTYARWINTKEDHGSKAIEKFNSDLKDAN